MGLLIREDGEELGQLPADGLQSAGYDNDVLLTPSGAPDQNTSFDVCQNRTHRFAQAYFFNSVRKMECKSPICR